MAFQASAHPGGEAEFARGAGAAGAPFCLSTLATTSLAALAAEAPHAERWYQVYVFRDRGLTRELVAEATELGYRALVVTVDLPVFGRRDRDLRSGFAPTGMAEAPMVSAAGGKGPLTPAQAAELLDPTITWSDLEQLVAGSRLPVLVKGLLDPADAGRAAACGAAGVVVSNHGARQLDTVAPTAEALGPVVDLVGDRTEVFVDGGVRRGTDVVKALALGARGVLVGRPLLWAFAVAGAAGVARAVEILLAELDVALTLTGVGGAVALDRSVLGGPGPPGRPGQVMS
jgi:isopentenyl diphosphate isomerase/L-lactate dehydrogenase-like FMN-dependent dehydrogenase